MEDILSGVSWLSKQNQSKDRWRYWVAGVETNWDWPGVIRYGRAWRKGGVFMDFWRLIGLVAPTH